MVCSQNSKIDPLPRTPLPGQPTARRSRTLPELQQGSRAQMTRMEFITEQFFQKGKLASLGTKLWLSGKTGKAEEEEVIQRNRKSRYSHRYLRLSISNTRPGVPTMIWGASICSFCTSARTLVPPIQAWQEAPM